jgi:hypothetical protein
MSFRVWTDGNGTVIGSHGDGGDASGQRVYDFHVDEPDDFSFSAYKITIAGPKAALRKVSDNSLVAQDAQPADGWDVPSQRRREGLAPLRLVVDDENNIISQDVDFPINAPQGFPAGYSVAGRSPRKQLISPTGAVVASQVYPDDP